MKVFNSIRFSQVFVGLLILAFFSAPRTVQAQQNWHATVGGQSNDMGKQALAFLPNEIWIHADDSITWTFESDEIHTLTFLTPGQILPSFQGPGAGCPGFASSGASFSGTCVSTPPMVKGQTFTLTFPIAGNYKFECLVHNTMTGAIHVLGTSETLPHNQSFYDDQATRQRKSLLSDTDQKMKTEMDGDHGGDGGFSVQVIPHKTLVTAGIGEMTSTPGGYQQLAIVRFLKDSIEIHAGDTVEWSNHDPDEPHTITFGTEPPANEQFPPSSNVTVDSDGARHAVISAPGENVHSGFIVQALEDEGGVPSNTLAANPTRFRVTFTQAGTYPYICVLHDNLGMVGKVVVLP
jgi:plastocyanin